MGLARWPVADSRKRQTISGVDGAERRRSVLTNAKPHRAVDMDVYYSPQNFDLVLRHILEVAYAV